MPSIEIDALVGKNRVSDLLGYTMTLKTIGGGNVKDS